MKNAINWLIRNCDRDSDAGEDYFYGTYHGHRVRYTHDGRLQVGAIDFDRWANSVAYEIKVDATKSFRLQLGIGIYKAKENTVGYQERSFRVMQKIAQTIT
jgi:hypothetical protein